MKPAPAPDVPGNTPWERLGNAVDAVFRVPKAAVLKEEKRLKRLKAKRLAAKKTAAKAQHGHPHAIAKERANAAGAVEGYQA
ncbi:MAG: hypothetical protein ACRD2O_00515 [Terriglobia bacterium]